MGTPQSTLDSNEDGSIPTVKHTRLTRVRRNCNPMSYYEVEKVLGNGSMGSVCKVIKRASAIGGSAYGSELPWWEKLPRCCTDIDDDYEEEGNRLDQLLVSTANGTEWKSTSKIHASTVSSIVSFDHKDTYYALKSVHLELARSKVLREELRNEVEILKQLDHPNIVRAMETFEYRNSLYIVLELCSGGDLYTRDPYTEEQAARIVASVLSAISYMHSRNITHRDLKYENVMFSNLLPTADIKIIDFGLSKKYAGNEYLHDAVGTVYSMSPQVISGTYTMKADVWAVGVMSFMLLSSSMPFYGKTRDEVLGKIRRGRYSFSSRNWRGVSLLARDFVSTLLTYDSEARPSAEVALQLPWLKQNRKLLKRQSSNFPERMDAVQASIEMYASYSMMKKLGLMVIAHRSDSDEVGFLRRMFKAYDVDGDGTVSLQEFKDALKDYRYTEEEVERIFHGVDVDRTGVIHYSEFLAATMEAHGSITEERIAEAFDHLDNDDTGYITAKNLHDFLGDSVPESVLNKIIDDVDFLHQHKVNYDEFLSMWSVKEDSMRLKALKWLSRRRLALSSSEALDSSKNSEEVIHNDDHADHFFQSKAAAIRSHKAVVSGIKEKVVGRKHHSADI